MHNLSTYAERWTYLYAAHAVAGAQRGILHPRLFGMCDLLFSVLSAATGPARTVFRLTSAVVGLVFHLYRSDVLLMNDRRFLAMDLHYRSTLGLLAGQRIKCEYEKMVRVLGPNNVPRATTSATSNAGLLQGLITRAHDPRVSASSNTTDAQNVAMQPQ